jgi:hypothetical protein
MEIAVLLAAGLRDWVDFGVIIGILLLNATVGWYQEKQAADVVASLKGDIAMRTTVVRDGAEVEIKARELVPGDIVSDFQLIIIYRTAIDPSRLLSRTVKLFPLMPALSRPTTTPTGGLISKKNSNARLVKKKSTRATTTRTTSERSTAPAMPSSPSINLP